MSLKAAPEPSGETPNEASPALSHNELFLQVLSRVTLLQHIGADLGLCDLP